MSEENLYKRGEPGGCAPPSTAASIEKAYEHAMSKLRGAP